MKVKVIRVIPVTLASWRAAFAAFNAMKGLFALALAAVIVLGLLRYRSLFWPAYENPPYLQFAAWTAALDLCEVGVLSILAIAVHRFVLLSETTSKDTLFVSPRRLLTFAAYAAIPILAWRQSQLWMLFHIPLIADLIEEYMIAVAQLAFLAALASLATMVILFPAIAVDAEGANLRNAWRDSWRGSWRILLVVFCTQLPIYIGIFGIIGFFGIVIASAMASGLQVTSVIMALFFFVATPVFAACGSFLYLCYSDTLGQSAIKPAIAL